MAHKRLYGAVFFFFLVSILILAYSVHVFFTSRHDVVAMQDFTAAFIVGENVGFDLNRTALTFGKIPPGGTSVRTVFIENKYPFPLEVTVLTIGDIQEYVWVDPILPLAAGENRSIPLMVRVPTDMAYGTYEGIARFVLRAESSKRD